MEFTSGLASLLVGLGADAGSWGDSSGMNSPYVKLLSLEVTSIRASRAALISPTICTYKTILLIYIYIYISVIYKIS